MSRIVLLGTGCPSPSHLRYGPSSLIEYKDEKILIDAGSGVTQRLSQAGVKPSEIDAIFITHLHSDHIVDLYQLFISSWHTGRSKSFKVYGPKGIKSFFQKMLDAFDEELSLRKNWERRTNNSGLDCEIVELNFGDIVKNDKLSIKAFEVDHFPVEPAFGYAIFTGSEKIIFSGDTRYSQNLINEADKAEYLIHEVFVRLDFDPKRMTEETVKNVEDYHTRPEEVAKLAQLAEVKSLILNHFVPPVFDESKLKETIAEFYKGDIFVGEDLMEFKLL